MDLKINREELNKKNKIVDNAIFQLKKEFVGIDEQIDSIMNNVRIWFLYPQLQIRPCVINIFGMTGCGKSSLVRRIAQLLDIEKNFVYFNFCAINEQNSWEIENDIEEELDNGCSNRMFVYDEFQYAATLDSNGVEKDNKSALKPFWELLDTGILHKRTAYREIREVFMVLSYMMRINSVCPMKIVNGEWLNAEECLLYFKSYDSKQFLNVFQYRADETVVKNKQSVHNLRTIVFSDERICEDNPKQSTFNEDECFFLQSHILSRFVEMYSKVYNVVCDTSDIYHKLEGMNSEEICDLFNNVYEKSQKGYDLKFNDSIIFVIANLDEAYDVALDVNPDMSPDQFYAITKKISIVDAKKALQKRFRNEQIARLGNIHVIYPSFSSKSFKKIIKLNLDSYKKNVKELCGLDVEFDKSIIKAVYDEAVYPTHGTRPIFSTIYEVIKTKLPHIIQNICDNNKDGEAHSIKYLYKNKKNIIQVYDNDGKLIDTYKFSENLRLDSLRTSSKGDVQANTAVHESGHFVIYSYLNGRVPEKIVSKSADSELEGFMMHNVEEEEEEIGSKIDYLNKIKVALGGYVAEGIIFGDDYRSNGASNDLNRATQIASKMVRNWGMCGLPFVTTHIAKMDNDGHLIKEEDQQYINDKIKGCVEYCLGEVNDIIQKPHILNMLKKSSKYLLNHSQMPKHIMNELLTEARQNGTICNNNENYYKNIVNKF